jgi:transposase, IS5 family
MRRQAGFFDVDDRLKRLSDLGDQFEAFEAAVEFEAFLPELNAALTYSDGTQGGRPPFDPVMMFKILVIQTTNNLSDERAEFLINDSTVIHAFSRIWIVGSRPRRPDDLAVPGETHEGRRHRAIKDGRIPDDWKDKPAKLRQKDRRAKPNFSWPRSSASRTSFASTLTLPRGR